MEERVQSKNLFHYQLNGVVDEQVAKMEEETKQQMSHNAVMKEKFARVNSDDPTVDDLEAVDWLRSGMATFSDALSKAFNDAINKCEQTKLKVRCYTKTLFPFK